LNKDVNGQEIIKVKMKGKKLCSKFLRGRANWFLTKKNVT